MKAFLLTFLIPYSIALRCFQCSDLKANQAKDCSNSSKEISQWSNLPGHYSENNDKKGLACVLGVDSSKNVYFQAKLDENQCKSSGYQTTIKIKINQSRGLLLFLCNDFVKVALPTKILVVCLTNIHYFSMP